MSPAIKVVLKPPRPVKVTIKRGIPGKDGASPEGADLHFVYTQGTPSSTWVIKHNLAKFPNVFVQDTANDEVEGDVEYVGPNELIITFSAPFSGKAYLN